MGRMRLNVMISRRCQVIGAGTGAAGGQSLSGRVTGAAGKEPQLCASRTARTCVLPRLIRALELLSFRIFLFYIGFTIEALRPHPPRLWWDVKTAMCCTCALRFCRLARHK